MKLKRCYPSGYEKRKKKQRVEKLLQSQTGAIDKFVTTGKPIEHSVEDLENKEDEGLVNNENENLVNEEVESLVNNEKLVNEEGNENLGSGEANQDEEMNVECEPLNIDDPGNWKNIDQNLRDLLVERGPVRRDCDVNFPKDANARHFSSIHYIRHLANGEKLDRKWLIYSEVLDRVFCFCCKLFKQEGNKTQLATEGFKDWKNIGERLKGHESNNEHITCMSKWIELEKRLGKNETIDKSTQDQISKEREHWRRVLLMIIAVVKFLAKNNLPFRGSHEKIYEESNGVFLSAVVICLQSEDMDIDVAVKQLKGLITYFERYREIGIVEAMVEAKEMASEMKVEPSFVEKRIICRKKQFDEDVSEEVTQSVEESFRVNYFLYIVDKGLLSLKNRFEQFRVYEANFGFLFNLKKTNDESLKTCCENLERFLKHGGVSDIDGRELSLELKVLKDGLPKEVNKPIEVLKHLKTMDNCFPNSWIAYRILLTIPVTVASGERSFSKLKLIKNYLRSTMSQERLNGLAMLSIENDFAAKLDYGSLIDLFASKNARRAMFK